jgi:TolA-binding protein
MKQKLYAVGLGILAILLATTTPADAANKEHQQLMADLRMLQEQSQVLQNLIGQVADAVKTTNARIDQQTETNRKSLADQKLIIDSLSNDVRVVKEKLDDNNVRVGQLTTEVNALRQAIQSGGRSTPTSIGPDTSVSTTAQPPNLGDSPTAAWDAAYSDYTAGQYQLAINEFGGYIRSFPKSDKAVAAQVYVCRAYVQDAKYTEAIEACDLAIRTYPNADVSEAYFLKGLAYSDLKNINAARDTWEELQRKFPGTTAADQAKQRLDTLRRPN